MLQLPLLKNSLWSAKMVGLKEENHHFQLELPEKTVDKEKGSLFDLHLVIKEFLNF